MRKYSLITLVSMLSVLLSCEKMEPGAIGTEGQICLSVTLNEPATKAGNYITDMSHERAVNSVSYYIFNSGGKLEAIFSSGSAAALTRSVSTGAKTVWAVVNIPDSRFSGCTTLSAFEAKEVSFSDMGSSSFPMAGKKSVTVTAGTVSAAVTVERFVSRLCFAEITNALTGKFSRSSMILKSVFVSNIAGNCKVTGSAPSSRLWYNKFGRKDGGGQSAIISSDSDASFARFTFSDLYDEVVTHGSTFEDGSCLYFFPNPATSDVNGWSSSFSQRYTRIVTAIEIDGETYYYPVNIVGTLRNHAYTLYLTITHLGSKDPDTFQFVEVQDVTITVGGFDEFDDDFEITF